MKKVFTALVLFTVLFIMALSYNNSVAGDNSIKNDNVVKAVVIGGMTMTAMWDEVSRMFESRTGMNVEVIDTDTRPDIEVTFKQGKADFLTMHSGDITTDLVADGYGIDMKPWTHNN